MKNWTVFGIGAIVILVVIIVAGVGKNPSPAKSHALYRPLPNHTVVVASSGSAQKQALVAPRIENQIPRQQDLDQRQKALYEITQKGFSKRTELSQIAMSPLPKFENLDNPHSIGSYKHREEINLRITALEALDKLAIEHPQEMRRIIEEVAAKQQEPTLRLLIHISLDGIYTHRPGKLSRAIDAMIAEKENS